MTIPLLFRRRPELHRIHHDLPAHIMRDIGLPPGPDRPHLPFHPLWRAP